MSYRLSNYEHVPHSIVGHDHIQNLLKLRAHLIALPADYERFDMTVFAATRRGGPIALGLSLIHI